MTTRHDWTVEEIRSLHDLPLFDLLDRAREVHRAHQPANEVQLATLLSVKTGGCEEDCGYCSQSARHGKTKPQAMLTVEQVVEAARRAKSKGATRFCMGTAWRGARQGQAFDRVLEMVKAVRTEGMETCVTLGLLTDEQASALKDAGLHTYNHNIDTSREYYPQVITTRTFDDRLATLARVQQAGIRVCTGGIIGMGESIDDRCRMLRELANMAPHPDSVPINALVPIAGTPLGDRPMVDALEVARVIAVARILMPLARVRLSAGRRELGRDGQLLCLYAGANSMFYGEELLTTPNPAPSEDDALLAAAGLHGQTPIGEAAVAE